MPGVTFRLHRTKHSSSFLAWRGTPTGSVWKPVKTNGALEKAVTPLSHAIMKEGTDLVGTDVVAHDL